MIQAERERERKVVVLERAEDTSIAICLKLKSIFIHAVMHREME